MLMSLAGTLKRFHDVTIVTSNVAELRRFYLRLGFQQVVDDGDDLAVFLVGENELAIHTSAGQPTNAIAFSILVDNLELIQRHVADLGISFDGPKPLRPNLEGITLLDPNGNKVEFMKQSIAS
jgi:catechol 2,3-dioxygenase-like lactoylglutathione lyase family enzyme